MQLSSRLRLVAGWFFLLLVTFIGVLSIVVRTFEGLGVTNLNYIVPWGLWVAFYIYFIGLSAGSFLLSTMIYVFGFKKLEPIGRLALYSALIALFAGMGFVLLDLGHMERFWTVFVNRNLFSVLEIEIHFYVLYIIIILAELWLLMRRDFIRCSQEAGIKGWLCKLLAFRSTDTSDASATRDRRIVTVLGIIGLPIAIGVHGGTGALFAVVKARPMWYGPLFPIIFIVSALVSGAALLTFLLAFFAGKNLHEQVRYELVSVLSKITAGLLVFDLLLLWSEFSVGLYGNIPEDIEVLNLIMFGPFWWVFWFVQIIFGAIVPLIIMFLPATRRSIRWIGFAGMMIVIGIIGVRLNIVIPALSIPVLPGLTEAYTVLPAPTQAPLAYPVEMVQWLSRLAVVAAIATVVIFAYIALRRLQEQEEGRLQRAFVRVGFVIGVFTIAMLVLNWAGGSPSLVLGRDLTNSPLNGILGQMEFTSYYVPSPNEWLSSAGMIGLSILLFIFGYNYLPLETGEGH